MGEPVTVNSLDPASATATEVTVPPDDGKICVKVIVAEPIVPLSVVLSHNVSALVVPSLIIVLELMIFFLRTSWEVLILF